MATTDFSLRVAVLLVEASAAYLGLADDIPALLSEEGTGEAFTLLRRISIEYATSIAVVNRILDDARMEGKTPFPPEQDPRALQVVLRVLGDSFTLLAGVRDGAELQTRPLIAPAKLKAALASPAIRGWVSQSGGSKLAAQLGSDPLSARLLAETEKPGA